MELMPGTQAWLEPLLSRMPLDRVVNRHFADDAPDLRRRARLVAAFAILALSGGWGLAVSHVAWFSIPALTCLPPFAAGAIALLAPVLAIRTRRIEAATHLLAACWTVACGWGVYLRGGLASGPLYAQVAIPFIALVIVGRSAAARWCVVIVVELVVFAVWPGLTDQMPERVRLASNLVAAGLFSVLVLAMGAAMEWLRQTAETELERAVERRANAEREAVMLRSERLASMGQLVASLAHEINNPLAYVLANVEYIHDELIGPEHTRHHEALADAVEGSRRIQAIISDLRTFSRDDEERLVVVDLAKVVASSVRIVVGEVRHRARLEVVEHATPRVLATTTRLGQIVINLLVNAAHATDPTRPNVITVTVDTTAAGAARLTVRDTGVGMTADVLARVKEPFFTTKPIGVGTGLGLSVCDNLAASLGGSLQLESEPGAGTTVILELPAFDGPAAALPVSPSGRVEPAVIRRRVLVIDDEVGALRAFERALHDHEVVTVAGGLEALALLRQDAAFDLVVCDLMMPVVTGADVAETIQRDYPTLDSRLVLCTAGALNPKTRELVASKRYPVMSKPVDTTELRALVHAKTDVRSP